MYLLFTINDSMKKIMMSLGMAVAAITGFSTMSHNKVAAAQPAKMAKASKKKTKLKNSNSSDTQVDFSGDSNNNKTIGSEAAAVYNQINFGGNKVSFEAFNKAYQGYMNLKKAGKLSGGDVISIADFSLISTAKRLWVIDLVQKKVLFNTQVAHGQGSGGDYATMFSNNDESHQSSIGFYVTKSTYGGKHGTSLRIAGMDKGVNDNAEARNVVIHPANYCSPDYLAQNKRIGRSWGCPAVSPELAQPIINTIKDGTMLFIYAPQARYSSVWLNA
jgi:hypothetical protein